MRLIDADELLAQMIGMNDGWFDPRPAYDHESLIKIQPTINAAPVKHGRWIKGGYACGENEYKCSACGETEWRTGCARMKYCMCCGARMDLEEQDAKEET